MVVVTEGPRIVTVPQAGVSAGEPVTVTVVLENPTAGPLRALVRVVGLEPGWCPPPRTVDLPGGGSVEVGLVLTPQAGCAAGRYPWTLQVKVPGFPDAVSTAELVVDTRALATARLDPAIVVARRRARTHLVLDNHRAEPLAVTLVSTSDPGLTALLPHHPIVVPAQGSVRVPIRLRTRRVPGRCRTLAWTVTAHGATTPVRAEGTVRLPSRRSRTALGQAGIVLGLLLLAALWAPARDLTDRAMVTLRSGERAVAKAATRDKAASGGVKGATAKGAAATRTDPRKSAVAWQTVRVQGSVLAGHDGRGVRISYRALALTSGKGQSGDGASAGGTRMGMALPEPVAPAASEGTLGATDRHGLWALELRKPWLYEVSFSKLGRATRRIVVDTSADSVEDPREIALAPGTGSLTGRILDAAGKPVPNASVEVADGRSTLITRTRTSGSVGTYTVPGLEAHERDLRAGRKPADLCSQHDALHE
ncbi:MAG: large repetitive protein, partial [Actinomycetota bacterium]|nr:large repetitive protein [Actinomycetota bacterium]